jgi:hypothetical protein
MRMGCPVVASFYPEMQKHLLNASDPPPMTHMAMSFKLTLILKIKLSQFLFLRVDTMMTRRTRAAMILISEMKRYG